MVLHLQGNTLVQVAPCGELPSSKPGAKLLQPGYSESWCVIAKLFFQCNTGCFFHWASPKKLKYGKPRLGESTLM